MGDGTQNLNPVVYDCDGYPVAVGDLVTIVESGHDTDFDRDRVRGWDMQFLIGCVTRVGESQGRGRRAPGQKFAGFCVVDCPTRPGLSVYSENLLKIRNEPATVDSQQ